MRRFEDFLGHEYDVIAQMAELLTEAQNELDAGNMTKSEFDEIANNLLDFVQIDSLAGDVDKKIIIKEAIEILKFIADHIPMA